MNERLKEKLRRYHDLTKYPALVLLITGTLHGLGQLSYAPVQGIQTRDMNDDGVQDEIVIFPLRGTNKGLLGYIDGNDLPRIQTTRTPKIGFVWGRPVAWVSREYTLSYLHFNPLNRALQTPEEMYPELHSLRIQK